MKNIFLFLIVICFLVPKISISQIPPSAVVNVDSSLSSSFLYGKSLSFFAKYFKSANDVIQLSDAENRKVIGKGIVGNRNVMITIDSKNGKYRYDINIRPKTILVDTTVLIDGKYFTLTGNTILKVVCNSEKCYVDINESKFITTGFRGSNGGPNGGPWEAYYHTQPSMLKNKWVEWKLDVDSEASKINKYLESIGNPNDVVNQEIIKSILSSLESEINDNW